MLNHAKNADLGTIIKLISSLVRVSKGYGWVYDFILSGLKPEIPIVSRNSINTVSKKKLIRACETMIHDA